MIIIGYPGVGKTDASKNFAEVIDFESSVFGPKAYMKEEKIVEETNSISSGFSKEHWIPYVKMAEELSRQGLIVCVSSHSFVQELLLKSKEQIYVCYPNKDLKVEWQRMLRDRYLNGDKEDEEKNIKALEHVYYEFEYDIDDIMDSPFDKLELPMGTFLTNVLVDSINHAREVQEQAVEEEIPVLDEVADEVVEVEDVTEDSEQE